MEDSERDALISEMSRLYSLHDKYARYANACERALLSLSSASGGVEFLYGSQTQNVCGKVNKGIHPDQGLLDRLCLSRQDLDVEIERIYSTVDAVYYDAFSKSLDYESQAMSITNQLQWG